MAEKSILLKEETVLGLNKHVRLRREATGIILYWAIQQTGIDDKIDISKTYCLPSSTAMMLALFDGKRSLQEVFQAVKHLWDKPSETFADFCKVLEKFILNVEPFKLEVPVFIEVTGDKEQKFMHYDPESFIIKGDKFCPDHSLPFKFPISITIAPSMDCFTDCVYCYMGRAKYSPLPFSRWEKLLKEMGKYQLANIGFSGGDPMCYEHTVDMLEIASTFDPPTYMSVATKAYISLEIAHRLSRIPRLEFQISLDSTNPEVADAMTQRKGHGKRAIKSFKNLVKAGITPAVKAVVTPATIQDMPRTILDLHNLGVHPIRVTAYGRSLWHHKDEFFNKASEWEEFMKRVEEIQTKHGFKIQLQGGVIEKNSAPLKSKKERKKIWDERSGCTMGKQQAFILPDGNLLGCEQIPQRPEYFLGSVANDSLYDVWNSESFKKKAYDIPREKYKGTACYDCKEFEGCHSAFGKGYCPRESFKLFGTIYAPEFRCPYINKKLPRQQ